MDLWWTCSEFVELGNSDQKNELAYWKTTWLPWGGLWCYPQQRRHQRFPQVPKLWKCRPEDLFNHHEESIKNATRVDIWPPLDTPLMATLPRAVYLFLTRNWLQRKNPFVSLGNPEYWWMMDICGGDEIVETISLLVAFDVSLYWYK